MDKETLKITGMTCAACAARIEKVLGKMDGVDRISVNLATEKATISFDPQKTSISDIKAKIVKTGYGAEDIEEKKVIDEDKIRKEKVIRTLWTKFIVSAFFGIPLLYFAMGPMVSWLRFPIPNVVDPMQYPLNYAILQITLTLPIVAAGYRFYTVGYKAIISRSPNMDSLIAMGTTAAILYSLYSVYQIYNGNEHAVEAYISKRQALLSHLFCWGNL